MSKKTRGVTPKGVDEIESAPVIVDEVPTVKTERYIECNFCHTRDTKINNTDPTSSWCKTCGRCFPVEWKERTVK
jgi:MinD superfamily P-loop ATPase